MASTCSGLATWLTGMLQLPRLACAAAWNSIWQLALLFRAQPAGRVTAAADRWHRVLHATRRGSRCQSSSALLEVHLYVAPSDIASWAITASLRDDDHGPVRPSGERTRAVCFVWRACAKAQACRCASSIFVRHGCMPSTLGWHSPCTVQTGLLRAM